MGFIRQTIPQTLRTDEGQAYFSFGSNDTWSKAIFCYHVSQKSSLNESSAYTVRKEKASESAAVQIGVRSAKETNGNSIVQCSYEPQRSIECRYYFLLNLSSITTLALLHFTNDAWTYEMLFENTMCCRESCASPIVH